ncbi:hypothetical protein F0562_007039 [Nyssa sinensis]|uniref:Bulb-type lectin domain-containing protein n=1 Tax=Nyssa sinensis TaxID=561372 RepID=A0A5J5A6X5_9ASTE|nr:hypothetical protein F0562_007039 [Nyssa sinensis]
MHKLVLVMGAKEGESTNVIAFLIFTFLCIWVLDSSLVAGADKIGIGDELNSSSTPLLSQGGNFTLGFFTLSDSNYSYFGIWYTNDERARKVWVANPNTPLLNNSGVLTIDSSGVLKITSGGSTILNISDQVATGNVTATLLDSGAGASAIVLALSTTMEPAVQLGVVIWSIAEDNPGSTIIYALVPGNSSKGNKWWTWLIIALAIFLLVLFLGLFYYLRIRNRRREVGEEKKLLHELTTSDSFNNANEIANVGRRGHNLRNF